MKESILMNIVRPLVDTKDPMEILNEGALLAILFEDGYTTCEEFKEDGNLIGINMSKESGDILDKIFITIYREENNNIAGVDLKYKSEYHNLKVVNGELTTVGNKYLIESVDNGDLKNIYREYLSQMSDDTMLYYDYVKCVDESGEVVVTSKMLIEMKDTDKYAKATTASSHTGIVKMHKKITDVPSEDSLYETVAMFIPIRNSLSFSKYFDNIKVNIHAVLSKGDDYKYQPTKISSVSVFKVPTDASKLNTTNINEIDHVVIWNESMDIYNTLTTPFDQNIFVSLHGMNMHISFKDGKMTLDSDYIAEQFDDATKKRNLDIMSAVNSLIDVNRDKEYEDIYDIIKAYFSENDYAILDCIIDLILCSILGKVTDKVRLDLNSMTYGAEGMRPLILKAISDYDL